MKVRIPPVDINDHVRGGIRARNQRGGKATRREVREFILVAVRTAIDMLPPPKVRAPKRRDVERRTWSARPDTDTIDGVRAQRERIRAMYRTSAVDGGAR